MRNKVFSAINIVGLAIGIAAFIMVSLYVANELSVDKFNEHYDDIYRIEAGPWFHVPTPLIPIISREMPDLKAVAPTERNTLKFLQNGSELYIRDLIYTQPEFFDIFTIEMISGVGRSALEEPLQLLLSETEAKKLFGEENPIGKQILVDDEFTFTIAGVFKDFPDNSHLYFAALSSLQNRKIMSGEEGFFENWSNWNYQTYIRLSAGADANKAVDVFNSAFNKEMAEQQPDRQEVEFSLRHLYDIYFFKDLNKDDYCKHGNMQYLLMFATSALLTLIIAVINYINLYTARAGLRAIEIGIRRVNGANRKELISQFMGESFVVSSISFVLAIALSEILLPQFNNIIGKDLALNLFANPLIILYFILGMILIAVLTGLYPAFYMSSFNTIAILKKENIKGKRGLRSRRILMIFQFVITISLILGTLIIFSQMRYMVKKDLGYDKEHILYFGMNSELKEHREALKQKLLENTEIKEVAITHSLPGNFRMEWGRNLDSGQHVNFFSVPCDEDYIPLLELEFIQGRNFNPNLESDKNSYIINEAFVKTYNLEDPLSESSNGNNIVGVVKDFTFQSLHFPIKPMAFVYKLDWAWQISVKIIGKDIGKVTDIIQDDCSEFSEKKVWAKFLDSFIETKYENDKRFSLIFTIFSILAIIISGLGLLGLISFEANRRTKEIGIRKVLGASPLEIVHLFNKEIFVLLGISSIIAWSLGYFMLNNWLQNFAYRINLDLWYFALSTIITAFIALFTFSSLAFKAANSNPVDALKYE